MKLDVAVNEVVLSNTGTQGEFKIRNSAKAFKILSDGLYSNKIKAIIRELSCNAIDSHVAAGKPDAPITVHLPTVFEPWFSVADSGIGLDGHQVTNIYTTYFESTKTDSNDFIGALGLGSKSPFSYTENFTVTAVKSGVKRIYSAFINESGIPCVAEMSEALTDDANGVEVMFSVTDRSDYNSFRNEASNVFKWFKVKPVITGVDEFEISQIDYKERNIVPGVHVINSYQDSFAVMGNIAYPLRSIPEPEKHFGACASLLNCGLVLECGIGELDFAASREELSYVPLTIRSIKAKLELLNDSLAGILAAKANLITCAWKKAVFLRTEAQHKLFRAAVVKYVTDTKFALYDVKSHYGHFNINLTVDSLAQRELELTGFRMSNGVGTKTGAGTEYVNNVYTQMFRVPVEPDVVFVLNDLKTGCGARAKYHYSDARAATTIICVNHKSDNMEVRQKEYDLLLAELHNPPNVVKASTLKKRDKSVTAASMGITKLTTKESRSYRFHRPKELTWAPTDDVFDDNTVYYYVGLNNHNPIDQEGKDYNMFGIKANMNACGIPVISGITIYGVRKSKIKDIQELDNWVWIGDKLKEETAKITDKNVASLVVSEMLDSHSDRVYTNKELAGMLPATSPYAKFIAKFGGIKKAEGNISDLLGLCAQFGKSVQVDKVRAEISSAKGELDKLYPLLKHCYTADKFRVAEYINIMDKQEKNV